MNIDKAKMKSLAQAVIDLEDPWYTGPQLTIRAVDAAPAALMAALTPEVVLALLAEIESLQEHKQHLVDLRETHGFDSWSAALVEIDRLKSENEALRKDLESHKRMLLAAVCDVGAIGEALGADMDDDGSEIEGLAKELRKDAERYRFLMRSESPDDAPSMPAGFYVTYADGAGFGEYLIGDEASKEIDAAMAKEDH